MAVAVAEGELGFAGGEGGGDGLVGAVGDDVPDGSSLEVAFVQRHGGEVTGQVDTEHALDGKLAPGKELVALLGVAACCGISWEDDR